MGSVTMHDHIQYLLYRHNCLILPGFGGIVLQYSPARIHPAQHIFQPPRKALAFNRSLTTNDGLLITHVANAENLHYDDAERQVRRFVDQIEDGVRRKGEYAIPGIGRFYNDVESNLQFEPDDKENYLLGAYGLDRFVSPAIVRRDAFEPNPAADKLKKKRRFNWFGLTSLLLVSLLFAVQFLSINNLAHVVQNPLAGIPLLAPLGNVTEASIHSETPDVLSSFGKRDTVVQIIVIKDETSPIANDEAANPLENSRDTQTERVSASNIVRTAGELIEDSIKLLAVSKVPMRGEYNPRETGRFIIVFSNSTDSTKASYFQKQLWEDRIGAQLLLHRSRLLVAKPGYLTAKAAAKDLYIYRLLGYDKAYIMKTKLGYEAPM